MKKQSQPQAFFTLGIAGLFLAGFFLLVTFGAATYRQAVESQTSNNRARALLSYISTCVRAHDHASGVEVRSGEDEGIEGPVLVIHDRDSGYAIRLYRWEGSLVEDYGPAEGPLWPEEAQVLGETEVFAVEEKNGVPYVATDEGQVPLRLRSGSGWRCDDEE